MLKSILETDARTVWWFERDANKEKSRLRIKIFRMFRAKKLMPIIFIEVI